MGTLTGAPKIKAMQLIYQFEQQNVIATVVRSVISHLWRSFWYLYRDSFCLCAKWRTHIQTGCGEVLDSDPQMEADETRHKAAAMLKAIKQINTQAK